MSDLEAAIREIEGVVEVKEITRVDIQEGRTLVLLRVYVRQEQAADLNVRIVDEVGTGDRLR